MGAKRNNTVMSSTDEIKIVEAPTDQTSTESTETTVEAPKKVKASRTRSAKYVAVRSQVDKTKKYSVTAAIDLIKKLSYTKFEGTITAHVVVKEVGTSASLTLPHSTGKTLRVAIADDAVIASIQDGQIDFDVLVAHPSFMPKLAKLAPVLGPKGLMPNPKNGTLTPNTEAQKKKLEAGTVTIKTEKKAPLLHVRMGKTSMDTKQLAENINALLKALTGKTQSLVIASTMSPGVKISTD
jgi:large subunit ribosomal protein L1